MHFRMKGLSKGDAKSIKQLRADGSALMSEHPQQVCLAEDVQIIDPVATLLFRTFNITEKGHAMAG